MRREAMSILVILIVLINTCDVFALLDYEIIDLGTLGGKESKALCINNAGQIVGWAHDSSGDSYNSIAYSINSAGQIVGQARDAAGDGYATLFDASGNGNNINLGTLGGLESTALFINDVGEVVGWACEGAGGGYATLFDRSGAGNNIKLGEGQSSAARSINNMSQIVGQTNHTQGALFRATLFESSIVGRAMDLGTLGGLDSIAYAINDAGQIVGRARISDGYDRAILFDPSGTGRNIDLGTLGGTRSYALSINDIGQIVGHSATASGKHHATLFDPSGLGNNIDLNSLIAVDSGWELMTARYINNNGWIVGQGINPNGESHAFLLVPEPTTLLLLSLGGAALIRRRWI
jgi:probable HAF family extracellular repeat protein